MNGQIDRRTFLQRCLSTSIGAMLGSLLPSVLFGDDKTAISEFTVCAVAGDRYFENTMTAIEALGGMKKFVKKDATVALLINSVFERFGTYVNPDIPLAVAKMCLDAGAKSVMTIESTPDSYWRRSTYAQKLTHEISLIGRSREQKDINIERAKIIKEGSVSASLLASDVFINIPIIKDYRGVRYTGNLKNMMGAFSSSTCRHCHFGDRSPLTAVFQGYYSKPEILAQSIADLNLVRKPDLCVADVTEILTTNGPAGPGNMSKPMQVVAGTDPVAVDMYCVRHLDLTPEELLVIRHAQEHGLGPKSVKDISILAK
jgi:uncharacterized protein (DUF362 family)